MFDIDSFKHKIDCQISQIFARDLRVWPYFSCKNINRKWALRPAKPHNYVHIYDLWCEGKSSLKDHYDIAAKYLNVKNIYAIEFSKLLATGYNYFNIDGNLDLELVRQLAHSYKRNLSI